MPHQPRDVPPVCPKCGAFGTVKLESTHKGASTALIWICKRCDHEWPVKGAAAA